MRRGRTCRDMERCLIMVNLTESSLEPLGIMSLVICERLLCFCLILHYLDLPGMGMMSGLGLVVTAGANFVQTAVKPL